MIFNDWLKRKLATKLNPYLKTDSTNQLHLKLGLFRSNGTLNNLSFDVSKLNQSLDEPYKFCFKEVTVEEVSLKFSPFSNNAFTLVARGVNIVLSVGEEKDERGVMWTRKVVNDFAVEERNNVLREVDPQGCALHGSINKISEIATIKWGDSLLNTVLGQCQLQLFDVNVRLQSPNSHDPLSCSLYIEKIAAGSRKTAHKCLVRGFLSSIFVPSEESSFGVDVNGLQVSLNGENYTSCVVPLTDLSVLVNMNHLQFMNFCVRVPSLKFVLSTRDLSLMMLFCELLSKELKSPRHGKQLWNIVACRIRSLTPNMSFIKVVGILCLWLRYIKNYKRVLLLVGYPADEMLRKSTTLMLRDARYSTSVKSQWKIINEIEKDMPLEGIILARRIIRSTGASNGENGDSDKLVDNGIFSTLHQLIALILSTILVLFHKILDVFLGTSWHHGGVHEYFVPRQSISLNIHEIEVSLSPDIAAYSSVNRKAVSESQHTLLSFHLSVNGFFLRHLATVSEQRLTFASGCMKVLSSSVVEFGASTYARIHQEKKHDEKHIIILGEPAQSTFSEQTHNAAIDEISDTSAPSLASLLRNLWLNWQDSCLKSEGEDTPTVQKPWILCDIRITLTDHGLNPRSLDFALVVGKANVTLQYFAITPIGVLFRQIQDALFPNQKNAKIVRRQTTSVVVKDLSVRDWFIKFRLFSRKVEMDIIRMLPEMHVLIGVLITGPQIQISFLNDIERTDHQPVRWVTFDICNFELLVSPNLEDNIGLSHERTVELKSGLQSKGYSCQGIISCNAYLKLFGLKIYLGESTTNQKYQIALLSPMTTQLNYLRKDHYSHGSSIVSISAALDWVTTGFSSLIFLDELYYFVKIFYGVFYESLVPSKNGSDSGLDYENRSGEAGYVESDSGEKYFNKSHERLLDVNTQFIATTTCEIKSFDVILHTTRKVVNVENYNMRSTERETRRNLTTVDLSGNGIYISLQHCNMEFAYTGGNIDAVIDTTGFRLAIFRYLTESGEYSDKSDLKNLLRFLNFLTEASVSHTKLRLILSKYMFYETSSVLNTERHSDRCFLVTVMFSGLYMAGCNIKDILVNQNNFEKLNLSFSAGEEFRRISCQSKGGYVLLEAAAAMMIITCFRSYYLSILELLPDTPSSRKVDVTQSSRRMAVNLVNHPCVNLPEVQRRELLWDHIELVSVNLLPLSLVLVASDESGKVQELLLEGDFHLKFELLDTVRKLSMSISKLSLLSRFMHGAMERRATEKVSSMRIQGQDKIYESPLNYILRDMQYSLAVEGSTKKEQINPVHSNSIWSGNASVSGLEITISLSEMRMMFSALESLSALSVKDETRKVESNHWDNNEYSEEDIEEMVTDGSVVAIQDVDQHTYIAVEGEESRYDIAGTIHYSLAGKCSLFRVKYHNSRWNSKVKYFSLISLYAKDESGEPLRLNSNSRSRFVSISCPNDGGSALWTLLPFKPDQYEEVSELEPFRCLSKKRFHLVNKKSDCAVAFVDGVLEFVGKPGHLFKLKVLSDPEINQQSDSNDPGQVQTNNDRLGITVTVDKITLTVVHELSHTEEKFLLLQGSLISNQIIMQITNSKVRFMSSFEVAVHHFDSHQNSWMDFIKPIEISTFYCFKFPSQSQETTLQGGVPGHFYAKTKEINILVTERALDILLFVIGELDLSGPYAIKSSVVLANCCKVENQSGLTLRCQFYDNQDVSVSPRQSTTTFLRHLALANRPPEASFCSVQLLQQGCLSTSPIHLSLSDARHFSWRTRIESSQDSKSFPGPFVAIEISRRIEDGLSIVVSPSLRIHNETDFSLELRFQRPDSKGKESASLMLKAGSIIDDAMAAFSAIDLSGGSRKALTSLSVGNYVFSFRPNMTDDSENLKASAVEWSDDLKGEKPVRLSGIFDKLTYQVRKALSVDSVKVLLTSAHCSIIPEKGSRTKIHFLIQTIGRGIPVINPDNLGYAPSNNNSPVAMQEQKEIFVLPTVEVTNLLHTEIHVSLTDTDPGNGTNQDNQFSRATIPYAAAVNFYANPSSMYFVITLISFGSSCTTVNSSDWVRKLQKNKEDTRNLDIELEFGGGKYFAIMRLSRCSSGTLKVVIFTPYALQNDTNTPLFCVAANKKPLPRADIEGSSLSISPDMGSYLPPNSVISWFLKFHKLHFILLEEKAIGTELDLDALSGLTEIDLESDGSFGSKIITRLGVSLRPSMTKEASSQIILLRSRYVICNESEQAISVRQCYIEDMEDMIVVNSKQRVSLRLKTVIKNNKEMSVVDKLLRKHTKPENDVSLFIQFRPNETGYSWSGPICVASLGRFFLKFRQSEQDKLCEFATVHVVEEGSTVVLRFDRSKRVNLPYKIENSLRDAPVTYYQKDSLEPETLGAGGSVDYVWDDLSLPHKLVIQLDDVHLLREINLDKVREWKPFYRNKQIRNLGLSLPLSRRPEDEKRTTYSRLSDTETVKVGYEIYAEGMTRVLRICEFSDRRKVTVVTGSSTKMRLRISYLAIHLLEHANQDIDLGDPSSYAPIIIARLERLHWDSLLISEHKYNQIRLRSLSVDEKWEGAPFAAMIRRHQTEKAEANEYILHVAVVLLPVRSGVKPVKYLSIVLQPLDLNLDEDTLMKIVPFLRTSLSQSTSRQQYYFDHFEIHPIKIIASFLPGDSNYSYSSTQETLRSLLHSVIKIPAIKSKTIELNGVLVTHALITIRELGVKCAQHYSWYAMRAIYIAKGSPLLPPAFASVFDDLASSSLDVFFDPSSGVFNLPGVTLGTLKLISKLIDNKGISGTKRYFGDLGTTLKTAGSNMIFAAVTEVSDSVLKGAETKGFRGLVNGFHQGILKIAMEPSVLGSAFMEGGPDRKIKLDRSPGVDELYIEGYLQAMLDTMYKQEYLRVRVIENQVVLKNLPPSSSLIEEIMENVKDFLASKALLKGGSSTSHSLRHIRGEREWRIGPTVLTLCEHLFVSFAIQALRKQSGKLLTGIKLKDEPKVDEERAIVPKSVDGQKMKLVWKWGIGRFLFSGIVAYVDGRLCRNIPHPLARRIVSGFLLSFLDRSDDETK